MLSTELLVVDGCKPAHRHEAELLDRTLANRHSQRLATILMTPDMPSQLEAELETVDPEWTLLGQHLRTHVRNRSRGDVSFGDALGRPLEDDVGDLLQHLSRVRVRR